MLGSVQKARWPGSREIGNGEACGTRATSPNARLLSQVARTVQMARLLLLARGAIYIFHMAASHVVGSVLNLALLADPFFPPRGSCSTRAIHARNCAGRPAACKPSQIAVTETESNLRLRAPERLLSRERAREREREGGGRGEISLSLAFFFFL